MNRRFILTSLLGLIFLAGMAGCGKSPESGADFSAAETASGGLRVMTDSTGRSVEIPEQAERIVCLNVGALRYTCYMQAQDLVVGVEDYEKEKSISRGYNYVNFERFRDLPTVGSNGEHDPEGIIAADPDVIVMSARGSEEADRLQEQTGIPVVVVPGSDRMMDEGAYETFRLMGELYGKEERARELTDYMDSIRNDLEARTAGVPDRPTVYVGGVSYKGAHGFEGTEAGYGPFSAIGADNLADQTGQTGPFSIDPEQVLSWDPDVIFLDYNGLGLINEDYASNPEYYEQLSAVRKGEVYSQISFRSSAANLDTALADTYYAASVLYPEQFADVDPEEKAGEIFMKLLGKNFYEDLKAEGYGFQKIVIGK